MSSFIAHLVRDFYHRASHARFARPAKSLQSDKAVIGSASAYISSDRVGGNYFQSPFLAMSSK
ncbi:MAG: hypothetical protein ACXVCG_15175, partial [Bdellovibrionota bacterium]